MQKYIIMRFKGIYKDKSLASNLAIFFLLMFVSVTLHTLLAMVLISFFADHGMSLIHNQDLTNQQSVNYLKLMQLFSGIGLFITPTLVYSYLTGFDFKFNKIRRQEIILIIAIMILIVPFITLLLEWNMQICFPEWLLVFDIDSEAIIDAFLKMGSLWDLLYTLLVIAVVPAIGEELFFRGYLQQKLYRWASNSHIAILITAFLFSIIHLDLQGIIPRFILGILLGYIYYWSRNLWIPILAHFVNNAQAVMLSYSLFKVDAERYFSFTEPKVDSMISFFSFASVVLLLYIFHQSLMTRE